MDEAALCDSDELARCDGEDHPFPPARGRNALELCYRYGLMDGDGAARIEPRPADPAVLKLFHDPDYLETLRRASDGDPHDLDMLVSGLGTDECPLLPGVYEFSLLATGATKMAADLVLEGKAHRFFNPVGGFHHAGPDHAEGFCFVNDVSVVLAYLLQMGCRVAFVDVDAHHGNGVQDAFCEDDRVLVIFLHDSGETLYP